MSDNNANQPEPDQDLDSLSFEEAFARLNETAASLEEGGLTLADATSRYEQGMILVRRCNLLLEQTELKITTLKEAHLNPGSGAYDGSILEYDETLDQSPDDSEGDSEGDSPDNSENDSENDAKDGNPHDGPPSLF